VTALEEEEFWGRNGIQRGGTARQTKGAEKEGEVESLISTQTYSGKPLGVMIVFWPGVLRGGTREKKAKIDF